MAATIEVNKQSVEDFLRTGELNPFVIPEYQRPYAWEEEQVETLFEDLFEFACSINEREKRITYFLGSIVSYENENGEQEIIDGQQRITSLFLLLRAIYAKLLTMQPNDVRDNFIKKIEPTLWPTDPYTHKPDMDKILLESRVMNNRGNQILNDILRTGKADLKAHDNYSQNYRRFQEMFEEVCAKEPMMIYRFIRSILEQAILLPITADTQDTALTIFSTLNDRGLPLSDSDIFKAKIYNHLPDEEKGTFIESWQRLEEQAANASESIQQLFYYYLFYLRAKAGDTKTTTPGLRKFYSANQFSRLYEPDLMENLKTILNIWLVSTNRESIEEEPWSKNSQILCVLDILKSYPNEFWKYPVVVYYLAHRQEPDFEENFLKFLKKLTLELLSRYLITPSINAVKNEILKLNVAIIQSPAPKFDFKSIDENRLKESIPQPSRNLVRMILKFIAYQAQDTLLPPAWEIEHILPQKYQSAYFMSIDERIMKENIEHIGNKIPLEKKLNIIASNGYFAKKKKEYLTSNIAITHSIGMRIDEDWTLDSIHQRDIQVTDCIIHTLKKWDEEYTAALPKKQSTVPSAEDLAKIEEFKKKGWI